MSSPRRLLGLECDVQRLNVSLNVGRCQRELAVERTGPGSAAPVPLGCAAAYKQQSIFIPTFKLERIFF